MFCVLDGYTLRVLQTGCIPHDGSNTEKRKLLVKIIDALHLAFDYVRTDENNQLVEKTRALDDVSIEIEEGSFVCVLGHNGSGKSTFAKLLNGLNLPNEGMVLISGKDTKDESKIWDIRKETGMVFQNPDNQIVASVVEEDVGFGP